MLTVRYDDREVQALVRKGRDLSKPLTVAGKRLALAISNAILEELRGEKPHNRSGALGKSWKSGAGGKAEVEITATANSLAGHIGSNSPYARIQEEGGTVTPKRGKFLAIPLDAEKTAAGVARHRSPREVADLFPIRSRAGNLLLVKAIGKKGKLEPHFLLRESVTLQATRYLTNAARKADSQASGIVDAAIAEHLAKVDA